MVSSLTLRCPPHYKQQTNNSASRLKGSTFIQGVQQDVQANLLFNICQVGSYSYDMTRMVFDVSTLGYIQNTQSIILDYDIEIMNLKNKDQLFEAGALGNFSLAGFEMVGI